MLRTVTLCALITAAGAAASVRAQDQPQAAAAAVPMAAHGSIDVGYRLEDVDGNQDTFRQLFDLSDGPRLFGIDFRATGGNASGRPFDVLTFNASGVGGDPFPVMQFRARRTDRYDVHALWRRFRFFDVAPLTPDSIDGLDTRAVTDHHSWSTSRTLTNVSATFHAATRLQLLFVYDRTARDGVIASTRSIDFIGSPTAWGGFARANPFPVSGPLSDDANRVTGGLSYSWDRVTLHYRAGYQTSEETLALDPLTAPERSINVGDPATANEQLSAVAWTQHRNQTTWSSGLSFVAQPSASTEWRGDYLYARARGPFSLDAAFAGSARTSSAAVTSPYQAAISTDGQGEMPNHIVDQGFTYRPSLAWGVDVDYRYSHLDSEATGDLTSVLADYAGATTPTTTRETEELVWRQRLQTIRATLLFQPTTGLTIRPGVRLAHRDIVTESNGAVDPATTHDNSTVTPEISVGYRPRSWFNLRGVIRYTSDDAAYTRMTPSDRQVMRLIATFEPAEGLILAASADRNDAKLVAASYESESHGASLQGSYVFNDRLTAFGSVDYRHLVALGDTTFLRGTAPITDVVMRDDETDIIWQGGATVHVIAGLELTATGIYDRITGTDEITGEPPLYGATRFPFGTVSISYDVPRLGRFSFDVQRTHMAQELLPLNDFQATMTVFRFTRGF